MSEAPEATPDASPCPMCMIDGKHDPSTHKTSSCPGWLDLDNVAAADLKGLLAASGLSVGLRREI